MEPSSFPLRWPSGWPRTSSLARKRARFSDRGSGFTKELTTAQACERLFSELRLLRVRDMDGVILSSNVRPTLHGQPTSRAANPSDPGVAIYFKLKNKDRVLACDTWDRLSDNIAALAAHIKAIRSIDRYGVGTIDQAFEGYRALPAKGGTWRTMLKFEPDSQPSISDVQAAYRNLAGHAHPDHAGGSHEAMAALNAARAEAMDELGYRD